MQENMCVWECKCEKERETETKNRVSTRKNILRERRVWLQQIQSPITFFHRYKHLSECRTVDTRTHSRSHTDWTRSIFLSGHERKKSLHRQQETRASIALCSDADPFQA